MKIILDEGTRMPTRAHVTDAGLDLYSREEVTIPPRTDRLNENSHVFDTGVHMIFPSWNFGKIEGKSGLMVNHKVCTLGGVIDEGYTGSIRVMLFNMGNEPYTVHVGDKIAQLIIQPYSAPHMGLATELPETDRGDRGFGSTGA